MNLENRLIFFLLVFFGSILNGEPVEEKPFVIVTTSYNNHKWVKNNIVSIFNQKYSNYRLIYVDDQSTDGTADLVEELVKSLGQSARLTLVRNTTHKGTLANNYHAIHSCKDEEIIISIDGDDWLPDDSVLQKINDAYNNPDVWLTHGTLIEYPNNAIGWSIPIPNRIITTNSFRSYRCPSHLRTFYAWLFKQIDVNDLMYKEDFLQMTGDQAMMFPMIEMCGHRHLFIPDIIYVYNIANPINDNKVNPQLQNNLEALIRSRPPYTPLENSLLKQK